MTSVSLARFVLFLSPVLVLAGCKKPGPQYAPPPPPEVTVAEPIPKVVPDVLEFTGVTRGIETVQVRARVKGFLAKKHVRDGQRVKAGDLLFTIDPRTYEASVSQSRAQVASREAALKLAEVAVQRTEQAAQAGAVPTFELDRARADRDAAVAQLELARAQLRGAELDLEFTQIRAPINGRLGLTMVDEGSLVGAAEPTLLTTIVNDSQVYAMYDVDERTLLEIRRANQNRRPGEDGRPVTPVLLGLSNENGYPHEGVFDKADNTVDPRTGTIRLEAVFDNSAQVLLPGLYVRIKTVLGETPALLVPDVAVQTDQEGRFVYVVNAKNKVERRNVAVGGVTDRMRIIKSGLAPDERVVVNGIQRARPGTAVVPVKRSSTPAPNATPNDSAASKSESAG